MPRPVFPELPRIAAIQEPPAEYRNLGGTDKNEFDAPRLRGFLDDLLNRIYDLEPAAHVIVATATPAVNN